MTYPWHLAHTAENLPALLLCMRSQQQHAPLRCRPSQLQCVQIAPVASVCLQHLAALLLEVCKNPMQPTFNHYLFESVAALIRHVAAQDPSQVCAWSCSLSVHLVTQSDLVI